MCAFEFDALGQALVPGEHDDAGACPVILTSRQAYMRVPVILGTGRISRKWAEMHQRILHCHRMPLPARGKPYYLWHGFLACRREVLFMGFCVGLAACLDGWHKTARALICSMHCLQYMPHILNPSEVHIAKP